MSWRLRIKGLVLIRLRPLCASLKLFSFPHMDKLLFKVPEQKATWLKGLKCKALRKPLITTVSLLVWSPVVPCTHGKTKYYLDQRSPTFLPLTLLIFSAPNPAARGGTRPLARDHCHV